MDLVKKNRNHQTGNTSSEVIVVENRMDKQEQLAEQKELNEFNSITQSVKPKNQNQQHNVRREGIGPINQKR